VRKGRVKTLLLTIVAASVLVEPAHATATVMECGPSKGHAYYADGWVEDGMKYGRLALIRSDDGTLDVEISDATGKSFTAKQDGATVVTLMDGPTEWAVLAAYPLNVTEIYVFNRTAGEVTLVQQKYGVAPIRKAAALRAGCR
jgi:hypothetical protein